MNDKPLKLIYDRKSGLFFDRLDQLPDVDELPDLLPSDPAAEYERLTKIPHDVQKPARKQSKQRFKKFMEPIKARLKELRIPQDDIEQIIRDFEEGGFNAAGKPFDEVVKKVCDEVERLRVEKRRAKLAERYIDAESQGNLSEWVQIKSVGDFMLERNNVGRHADDPNCRDIRREAFTKDGRKVPRYCYFVLRSRLSDWIKPSKIGRYLALPME